MIIGSWYNVVGYGLCHTVRNARNLMQVVNFICVDDEMFWSHQVDSSL